MQKTNKNLKYLVVLLLLTLFTIYKIFTMITPSALEGSPVYYTTVQLNVRSGPGKEYDRIGVLEKGAQVNATGEINGWVSFIFNGQNAYVKKSYLSASQQLGTPQTITYEGEQKEFALNLFNKVNQHRQAIGVPALTWDDSLYNVAYVRSKEIVSCWSHTRPDGRGPETAYSDCGVKFKYAAENLAKYATTEDQALTSWLNSQSHKEALEDSLYTKSAIYVYKAADGNLYIAQEFRN